MLLNNVSEGQILSNRSVTVGGLAYISSISNIQYPDIASPPVQVCFCRNDQPDHSYNPGPVPIRRGQLTEIPLSLAALDQINRPIEATIYNRLSSGDDLCQHHIQTSDGNCRVINFTASLSYNESRKAEELILLTGGPCKETPDSQVRLAFNVYCPKCPVGFELLEVKKDVAVTVIQICYLSSPIANFHQRLWLGIEIYGDNIFSSLVEINLNLPNGSDAQCANGRSGLFVELVDLV